MKKKNLFFVCLYALTLWTWEVQAVKYEFLPLYNKVENIPHGYDEIVLQGTLDYGVNPNAIEAGVNENTIYIGFNQYMGNMNISIYNSSNSLIYSTVVNTFVQQAVIIPFANELCDTYTVILNNANGYAEGSFERN